MAFCAAVKGLNPYTEAPGMWAGIAPPGPQ